MKIDAVVMRQSFSWRSISIEKFINAQIINAGDGTHEHPTQAISDMMSIQEKFGKIKDLNIAIIGDIYHTELQEVIFMDWSPWVQCYTCGLPNLVPKEISELGVNVNYNIDEVIEWADAVNILRIQKKEGYRFNLQVENTVGCLESHMKECLEEIRSL